MSDTDSAALAAHQLRHIPFGQLRPDPEGRAIDKAHVGTLAASITATGLLQCLVVTPDGAPDRFVVKVGRHRYAALKRLKTPKDRDVPCLVAEADAHLDAMRSLAENHHRRAMTPLEEADAFQAVVATGGTAETAAATFGVKPLYVRQRMQLSRLVPAARELLASGKMPLEVAQSLSSRPFEKQEAVAATVAEDNRFRDSWGWRSLLEQDAIRAQDALFDIEAGGIAVSRDLFDEKGEGFVVDRAAFMALQLAELSIRVTAETQRVGATWSQVFDWSGGEPAQWWDVLPGDRFHGKPADLEEGEELGVVGVLRPNGKADVNLYVRRPSEEGEDETGGAEVAAARAGVTVRPDSRWSATQGAAIDEVRALIACGAILNDNALAMRVAIIAILKTVNRGAFDRHLANIVLCKNGGHPSAAADLTRRAWVRLRELAGKPLKPGEVDLTKPDQEAQIIKSLPAEMGPAALAEALANVDEADLPNVLAYALTLTMDPAGPLPGVTQMLTHHDLGAFYRMGPYELGKFKLDQLAELAKAAGLEHCVTGKKGETIKKLVAEGEARHAGELSAPVFAEFTQRPGRRY